MNERIFKALCESHGLPEPRAEVRFAPPRRWRFDWLFEDWLALEVQGGLWTGGRHVRGSDLIKEHEKLREAVFRGYAVLFCTPQDVESGKVFGWIRKALESRNGP